MTRSTKVIDQHVRHLTWTAVYTRYGRQGQETCDSLEDAVAHQALGREYNWYASMHILGPDGAIVLEGDDLEVAIRKWRDEEFAEIEQ